MFGIRRRQFITLLAGAAAGWPMASKAQQPENVYRIAIVRPSGSAPDMAEAIDNPIYFALFKELRRLGYVERQNLIVERYSGEGRQERYSRTRSGGGAYKSTSYHRGFDPLGVDFQSRDGHDSRCWNHGRPRRYGVVSNLAWPGGNVTGVSVDAGLEIWAKRLQILQEVVPTAEKVGYLNLRSSWDLAQGRALQDAARRLGIALSGPPLESTLSKKANIVG